MDKKRQKQRELSSSVKKHWVRLTRLCNNQCVFCLDKEPQNGTVVPFDKIKKHFIEGLKEGCGQVILSGGEATLHPRFLDLVKLAKKIGYKKIQVISNGRMFSYGNFLDEAVGAGVDEITFSIHGHTAKLHDAQTGIKGSFEQALAGLKNALATPDLIVNQDIVINKMNVGQLREIMDFFIDLGVREFDLLQIIPFGRAWDNRKKLFYDIEKELPNLQRAFELSKRENLFIWTNRFPARYLDGREWLIQNPKKILDEVRGRRGLFDNYLKTGIMPDCYFERCRFCFLENFCRDLVKYKNNGCLQSISSPYCLGSQKKEKIEILKCDKHSNIDVFVGFFISHRYFLKGGRCFICRNKKKCRGAHIDVLRRRGFDVLKPIK